ncbi:hypothetical protein HNI00_21710 [Thermoleptolyngbya oregonensis NK1-22]|uniref:Uncharacterized protein n=1 Tax=Thermoleptolyngbya oregonensis NK1-22 TaxID=2547457 RepID=A0AA96YEL0_9CYAN|nr:hypothetical protein [Thermoleptolyngbya oregonensis]WOB45455.1 hypothetical protein HNI00_21710 [Thermoleptolyngbya oregonensis NK1-22]
MKKLILTAIKCDGLTNGETKRFVPHFRGIPIGAPVEVTKNWRQWGNPAQIPGPKPTANVAVNVRGKIELRSVNNDPLYESRQEVSHDNPGNKQTTFTSTNGATSNVNHVPRLKFTVE